MSALSHIRRAYLESNARIQEKESAARAPQSRDSWSHLRNLNDQAYFMMLFAHFEDLLKQTAANLVQRRRLGAAGAANRRAWHMIRSERLSLMDNVALLTQKGGTDYNAVDALHQIRNKIAHGSFASVRPISIADVYSQLTQLIRKLGCGDRRRSPA